MKFRDYIKESTISNPTAVVGDDDFPTGNILMGDKYKKIDYHNRLTNFNSNWIPDGGKWLWNDFGAATGQESEDAYHKTLKIKNNRIEGLRRRIFAHMTTSPPKPVPRELRALGNDIFPDADPFGNKRGLDYVKTADVTEDDTDKVVVDDPHSKIIDADDENLVDLNQMKKVLRNIDKYLKKNKKK